MVGVCESRRAKALLQTGGRAGRALLLEQIYEFYFGYGERDVGVFDLGGHFAYCSTEGTEGMCEVDAGGFELGLGEKLGAVVGGADG